MQKGEMSAKGGSASGGKNKKGNMAVYALLATILIISAIIIGYLLAKRGSTDATQNVITTQPLQAEKTQIKDAAADWQTYKNDMFGIEMKYPKDLTLDIKDFTDSDQSKEDIIDPAKAKEGVALLSATLQESGDINTESYNGLNMMVDISKTKYTDIDAWFLNFKNNFEKPTNYEGLPIQQEINSFQNMDVQGVPAKKYFIGGKSPFYDTCVSFIQSGYSYKFCYDGSVKQADYESAKIGVDENGINSYDEKKMEEFRMKYRKLLNDIVATIKLTPASEVANSQTYKNIQFGFQVTLPRGWENYKVIVNENITTNKNVVAYVYIDLPTSDKTWPGDTDPKTEKSLLGYASMFAVNVWSADGYKAELKRCDTEPDPSCPGVDVLFSKNNKYVFAISGPQAMPEDLPPGDASQTSDYLKAIKNNLQLIAQ